MVTTKVHVGAVDVVVVVAVVNSVFVCFFVGDDARF